MLEFRKGLKDPTGWSQLRGLRESRRYVSNVGVDVRGVLPSLDNVLCRRTFYHMYRRILNVIFLTF